jgi:Sulfotransferase family
MIICHQHKFIFLKTEKTAGTAIEAALSELCGPDDVITPFREESEGDRKGRGPQNYRIDHPLKPPRPLWRKLLMRPERYYHPSVGYYEHMPAWRVRAYVGEPVWRDYFKFAFVRNPWDRQISQYLYKTKSQAERPSLDQFVARKKRAYVTSYEIYTIEGKVAVDYVGRYESLDQDFKTALADAGVQQKPEIPQTNVTRSRKRDLAYQSEFTPAARDLVAEWYAPEIALFGYEF